MATRIVRGQKVNRRKQRHPTANFHLRTRPWQLQPFCIFPVLPGETMQNAMWKSRVVSDPVKNRAYRDWETDRKSTRLNSSHRSLSRMPSSA